jgi:alpha-glucosidase
MRWLDCAPDVLAFTRGENFTCIVNLSDTPVRLPDHAEVLVSSQPLRHALLPSDTSVWLRTAT